MNIIIFAGGAGTRLCPLSRRHAPKQFGRLKGDQSTLQMAVERVRSFGLDKIFISTADEYLATVREQVPELPAGHLWGEPARRDLAAAVGLTLCRLKRRGLSGTLAMLWADHFMDHPEVFVQALRRAERLVAVNPQRFVFLGESPRFANHNLGWIHAGPEIAPGEKSFLGWKYRPELDECRRLYESGEWLWNPGYFVFDIDFVLGLYRQFMPEMEAALAAMADDEEKLRQNYPELPAISFDSAIIEHISPEQAVVLPVNLGWSDPGTLYALKETMASAPTDNYVKGTVSVQRTVDSFIVNEEPEKLVAAVGLDGVIVVNTKDALLVCHKDHVPDIKVLLKNLEEEGKGQYL